MAINTVTGDTDASLASYATPTTGFEGHWYDVAMLGSGYLFVLGGRRTSDNATINVPTLFSVTSRTELPDGSVRYGYAWKRPDYPIVGHGVHPQAVALVDDDHAGSVLAIGGADDDAYGVSQKTTTLVTHTLLPAEDLVFTPLADMNERRALHRATVLDDGRVFVTGGFHLAFPFQSTTEVWDPGTETWAYAASMSMARAGHGQIKLADGRVLVTGGFDQVAVTTHCEIYDPGTDTWATTGRMARARYLHSVTALPDGRVLAVGGSPNGGPTPHPEVWDPSTGLWAPWGKALLEGSRFQVAICRERLYIARGLQIAYLDLRTGRWRLSVATLSADSTDMRLVAFDDEVVLIAGGSQDRSHILVPAAETVLDGRASREARVASAPSATSFTYETPDSEAAGQGEGDFVTPEAAPEGQAGDPGPYLLDPSGSLPVTSIGADVGARLDAGRHHAALELDDTGDPDPALRFPDEPGWLVFRFGYADQVGPVRYLGRLSGSSLRLDGSFTFPEDVREGDRVVLLSGRASFVPDDPPNAGAAYVTASSSGRVAASRMVDEVAAGGVRVDKQVVYPGDRGLGGEGLPAEGADKLSDKVQVWAGDDVDAEMAAAREGD
jgi:hypothetical protein